MNKAAIIKISAMAICVLLIGVGVGVILSSMNNQPDNYIAEKEAVAAALDHAGVSEDEVDYIYSKLDTDSGLAEYEIEFRVANKEYDYEIDAISGKITQQDFETENLPSNQTPQLSATGDYIGEEAAKAAALDHAGVAQGDVLYIHCVLDYDDGHAEYDVEFWTQNTEYDYEIDPLSGEILSYDHDAEHDYAPTTPQTSGAQADYIGEEAAKAAALNHAGVAQSEAGSIKCELDYDDGTAEYEVEWKIGRNEYEYSISATTGQILEFDHDYDD